MTTERIIRSFAGAVVLASLALGIWAARAFRAPVAQFSSRALALERGTARGL